MGKQQMKRVIAVLNQKGGVGKTTTAVNVAAYMAKSGLNVLLMDFDPQGNATSGLGVDKLQIIGTSYGAMVEGHSFTSVAINTDIRNLTLIPTNADLAGVEIQLVAAPNRELKLRDFLHTCPPEYDVIIIDCPPSLGLLTVNALAASTDVLIPVQTEYYAMEGLSQLIQVIQRVQQGLNPTLQILGVVMTMFDSRTTLSEQVRNEIIRVFGDLVFKTVIPRNVRLAEAPSYGKPIMDYDKWSKGSRAYKSLTKELINRIEKQGV
jgi:chromosome partitioning protein